MILHSMLRTLRRLISRDKKFRSVDSSYFEDIREKLAEGFRNADEFGYMKG